MPSTRPYLEPGPFLAEQIKDGDRYELLHGNPIHCLPAGRDHALHNADGAMILRSDPDVEWSGVDAGFSPEPGTLRGLEPDAEIRARIHNCDDLEQLRVWLRKAVTVETVADIFNA